MGNTALLVEGIGLDNGGQVTYQKFTLTWDYIAAVGGASATATINLLGNAGSGTFPTSVNGTPQLPRGGFVILAIIHCTTQFAGVAGTLKISIGNAVSATEFTAQSADLVATAVADTAITIGPSSVTPGGTIAQQAISAFVTSSSGNLSTLTAGQVDILLAFARPSAVPSNIG